MRFSNLQLCVCGRFPLWVGLLLRSSPHPRGLLLLAVQVSEPECLRGIACLILVNLCGIQLLLCPRCLHKGPRVKNKAYFLSSQDLAPEVSKSLVALLYTPLSLAESQTIDVSMSCREVGGTEISTTEDQVSDQA